MLQCRRLAVALLLLAVPVQRATAEPYDCELEGCEPEGPGACGTNGITYANRCLAVCSGAAVASDGPCPPQFAGALRGAAGPAVPPAAASASAASAAPAAAAAAAATLAAHPVGAFLAASAADSLSATPAARAARAATAAAGAAAAADAGPAAAAAAAGRVTLADMRRYAAEGLVLAGAARRGAVDGGKRPADPKELDAAKPRASDRSEIYTVRVSLTDGLVYVSPPRAGRARDLLAGPPSMSTPSRPPADNTPPAAGAAPAGAPAGASAAAAARGAQPAGGKRGAVLSMYDSKDWERVTDVGEFPLTAVGTMDGMDDKQWRVGCTATLIGRYAAVTAGHCVFNKDTGGSLASALFTPHSYCKSKAPCDWMSLERPFGYVNVTSFDVMAGWRRPGAQWKSDMAVLRLAADMSAKTGAMGFGYDDAGYTGRVDAAGYPGETSVFGELYRLAGTCTVRDTTSKDATLKLSLAPPPRPKPCTTACAISERGQSGQPLFVSDSSGGYKVIGVLSRGPARGTCGGADVYTQIDKVLYDMLDKNSKWAPAK